MASSPVSPEGVASASSGLNQPVKPDVGQNNRSQGAPDLGVGQGSGTSLGESISSVAGRVQTDRTEAVESIEGVTQEIDEALDALNKSLSFAPTKAVITRDEELNRFIVKIADKESGEIIREIPSEAVLKFARNLREIKGFFIDKKM
jgi:uncharacterized FlaG/YvyC family protein